MSCDDTLRQSSVLIVKGNPSINQVALTFDAGANDAETPEILDALKKHNVKCTFFLTGIWVEKFPDIAMRIVSEGHEIGNHSYGHPDMCTISHTEMLNTVIEGEKAIINATGINPRPLFRQPFGSFNEEVLKAVGEAGYPYSIYWDVDPLDWKLPPKQAIVNRVLHSIKNGSIVLLHLDGNHTAEAADSVTENLKARGFQLVRAGELIKRL